MKKIVILLICLIVISNISINVLSSNNYVETDLEKFPYKQKLNIPFDTSLSNTIYQPIDMKISFDKTCWGIDEKNHSIRVAYDKGEGLTEIESQIYDLEIKNNNQIISCGLVFLIPNEADGNEKYYVLYDDKKTKNPDYKDHLSYEDVHYSYEPVSGQKIDIDYYKIIEDGNVVYGLCQRGELFGEGLAHTLVKMKPDSKIFETYNTEMFASFDLRYSVDDNRQYSGSCRAEKVSKSVLVDGNLMIKIKLGGSSPEKVVETNNIYTYYYSPTYTKRLTADVEHKILKDYEIGGDKERDGCFATLTSFKSRSSTIEKMNVGKILPFLHIYNENGENDEYTLPSDPDSEVAEWVISTKDDVEIGKNAWACQNDPTSGKVHGILFDSNKNIYDLKKEEDGLQIKQSVKQVVKLPGLEADTGSLFVGRNTYDRGGNQNTLLSEGSSYSFKSEFITFEEGGYESVASEADIFQKLVEIKPKIGENISDEVEEKRYNLTTYVHLGRSFPLGSLLSAAIGKNFSYIYAELYKTEGGFMSSGTASRLPTTEGLALSFENTSFIDKIKIVLGIFDWGNSSIFKKAVFPDLKKGDYIVKIYRENPLFKEKREFIGFSIVTVEENTDTRVFCRAQGDLEFNIKENEKGVKNVRFDLYFKNALVSQSFSDENGSCKLYAPIYPGKNYILKVFYKGFLLDEKQIKLGFLNRFIPLKNSFTIDTYNLNLVVEDTWGFAPSVDIKPSISSDEMEEKTSLNPVKQEPGFYIFSDLYPAKYKLYMNYKSFELIKNINLDSDKSVNLIFPAEYKVDLSFFDSYGNLLENGKVQFSKENKKEKIDIKDGSAVIIIPPSEYKITTFSEENDIIGMQKIVVRGDKTTEIISSQSSLFHSMITYLGFIIILASLGFILWKKKLNVGLRFILIGLLIVALVSPWWVLNDNNGMVSTNTKTLLIPAKIVSTTTSNSLIGGEISQVPQEVTMVLGLLTFLVLISIALIAAGLFTPKKYHKINLVLSVSNIILLITVVLIFFYAMSQITMIGVGSFIGSGDIDVSMPGIAETETITCSWGMGTGYILTISVLIIFSAFIILKRFKPRFFEKI